MDDTFRPRQKRRLLQPVSPIIVRAQQAMAADVLEGRNLRQRALELLLGQVQGIVVNGLPQGFKRL